MFEQAFKNKKSICGEGELAEEATVKSYLMVRAEGPRQGSTDVLHYSLPAILAVGYRVRTPDAEASQRFFATVQNKMHGATHGRALRR